ncbi:MAG: LOG family protein [Bdellovibrionota bacterium]
MGKVDGRPDFYQFSSFPFRETAMIERSVASVIAAGGVGTAWEILQTITMVLTGKKARTPIILLGKPADWAPTMAWLDQMVAMGTIKPADKDLVEIVGSADAAVQKIQSAMAMQIRAAHDAGEAVPPAEESVSAR